MYASTVIYGILGVIFFAAAVAIAQGAVAARRARLAEVRRQSDRIGAYGRTGPDIFGPVRRVEPQPRRRAAVRTWGVLVIVWPRRGPREPRPPRCRGCKQHPDECVCTLLWYAGLG